MAAVHLYGARTALLLLTVLVLTFAIGAKSFYVRLNPAFQSKYIGALAGADFAYFIADGNATDLLKVQFKRAFLKFDTRYTYVEMDWAKKANETIDYHFIPTSSNESIMARPEMTIPERGQVRTEIPMFSTFNTSLVCLRKGEVALQVIMHYNITRRVPNPEYNSSADNETARHMYIFIRKEPAILRIRKECAHPDGAPPEKRSGSGLSDEALAGIIAATVVGVFVVLFILAAAHFYIEKQKEFADYQKQMEEDDKKRRQDFMEKNFEINYRQEDPMPPLSPEMIAAHMALVREERGKDIESYLIPSDSITLGKEIGRGAFGKVLVGSVTKTENEKEKHIPVAIKTLKHVILPSDINEFLEEALVMKDFNHQNVVALIGVYMEGDEPPLVCLEFMHYGDLRSFLRRCRGVDDLEISKDEQLPPLRAEQLVNFCIEIAEGMAYLASRGFVHRDLASRNCMINQDKVVKIGDFGLARDIHEDNYYRMGTARRLPVKWMAFESLIDQVFTSMSDVWSYGVVMWEIFTLGQSPYPGVANHEILDHLNSGHRLTLPEDCLARDIYPIMASCWSRDKKQRPSFIDLIVRLKEYRDNFYVNVAVRTREDIEYQNINPKISATGRVDSVGGYSYAGSQGSAGSTVPIKRTNSYVSTPQGTANTLPVQESSPSPTGDSEEAFNPGYHLVQPITGEENGSVIPMSSITKGDIPRLESSLTPAGQPPPKNAEETLGYQLGSH